MISNDRYTSINGHLFLSKSHTELVISHIPPPTIGLGFLAHSGGVHTAIHHQSIREETGSVFSYIVLCYLSLSGFIASPMVMSTTIERNDKSSYLGYRIMVSFLVQR